MSLILDALRKMEQERRSRRGTGQDLRPEVLRYRLAAQPKEPRRYPAAVIAGVVLLMAGVGAGFLLKGQAPQPVAQALAVIAPAPQAPVAVPMAPSAPSTAVAPPAAAPVPATVPAAAPTAAPVVTAQAPAAVAPVVQRSRKASRAAASQPAPSDPSQVPAQEPAAVAAGAQDITISGIAYQDERRMRRAVLNGMLVGEGGEVGGARVLEIKETKVKLSRGGRVFEVPFSSGLQSR